MTPAAEWNPAQRRLALLMKLYALMYGSFVVVVLFAEPFVFWFLNVQWSIFKVGYPISGPPMPTFWRFVALSLVFSLMLISIWSARDVADPGNKRMMRLMVYGKFFSTLWFMVEFVRSGWVVPYFSGGFADFLMGAVALFFYLAAYPEDRGLFARLS